ncbi:thiolase family protein [Chrysiogenes arsenatis]|uniref:thiolase family protein n=1 Tax=Chrysiogenes arsenatis TaxID=309797 RepID=UPI00040F2348|nr:thiolase family protein [Chrysiogenes arsenatis]
MSMYRGRKVYVAAAMSSEVGKYNGREKEKLDFFALAEQAEQVFLNSPIDKSQIDAVVVGSQNPFAFNGVDNLGAKIAGILGISGAKSILLDTASSSGASAFENGYLEIASGRYENVLVIGIQKMSDISTENATKIIAGVIDKEESEYGLTMPACGALVARALMHENNLSNEKWSEFSAKLTARAHHYAAQNPKAHNNFLLPTEQYFSDIAEGKNYLYYEPLRYHDFCPMSDAVSACILTATPQDIIVAGVGSATDIPTIAERTSLTTFPATVIASRHAYGMAGIRQVRELENRVHINMHDPFNGFGPINMVDLGFSDRSELFTFLLDEAISGENGRFATNLTGGLKGRGHPLGATGMVQIAENFDILRQNNRLKVAISHSIGGPINNNVVIILENTVHYENRPNRPFRPTDLPKANQMRPKHISLETLFSDQHEIKARIVASTSKFHWKSGTPQNVLVVFEAAYEKKNYRFLIGTGPENYEHLTHLKPGDSMMLNRNESGAMLINEVPIMRVYRKTMDGVVRVADKYFDKLGKILKKDGHKE